MRPILFSWRGIQIYSYSAMMYIGVVLGIVASNYAANLAGLDTVRVYVTLLILTVVMLVGARLLHVVTHWGVYRPDVSRIWRKAGGGGSMQGGVLLGFAVSLPLLAIMRIPVAPFYDVAVFALLITMVIARIGCALHGCCGGRPSEGACAFTMPDHRGVRVRRIPTQFLEATFATLILAGAIATWSHRPFDGAIFLGALIAYNIGRLVLQPLRDTQDQLGPFNLQQALAATSALIALVFILGGWLTTGH